MKFCGHFMSMKLWQQRNFEDRQSSHDWVFLMTTDSNNTTVYSKCLQQYVLDAILHHKLINAAASTKRAERAAHLGRIDLKVYLYFVSPMGSSRCSNQPAAAAAVCLRRFCCARLHPANEGDSVNCGSPSAAQSTQPSTLLSTAGGGIRSIHTIKKDEVLQRPTCAK